MTVNVMYATAVIQKPFEIETDFFLHSGWTRLMLSCVLGRCAAFIVLLVPKPFGGR